LKIVDENETEVDEISFFSSKQSVMQRRDADHSNSNSICRHQTGTRKPKFNFKQ